MTQEFKSTEEIKEEVAKEKGFKNWNSLFTACGTEYLQNRLTEVSQRHSQQYIDANKELVEMLEDKDPKQGQKYLTQREAMEIVQRKWAENEGLKEACRLIRECAENGGNELRMKLTDNVFFYLTEYLGYANLQKHGDDEYTITW